MIKNLLKKNEEEETNRNEYDLYLEELNKIYTNDKTRAKKIARRGLEDLGLIKNSLGIDIQLTSIVVLCILIGLCGLLAPTAESIGTYFFGFAFFLAGLFTGLYVPVFGLIFLMSHGATGLYLMVISLFGVFNDSSGLDVIFNNPRFTDGGIPYTFTIYLHIIIAFLAVAVIYVLIHNLSPKLKDNKRHVIRILFLFFIVVLLLALLPRLFSLL